MTLTKIDNDDFLDGITIAIHGIRSTNRDIVEDTKAMRLRTSFAWYDTNWSSMMS